MKMELSGVTVEKVEVSSSKKNTGGAFAKMKLSAVMTKKVRRALGVGTAEEPWPPEGERSGKLTGSFDATNIILTRKQGDLLDALSEVDVPISLADSFTWKLEDPDDETNKTVVYMFWARTSDLTAAQLMVEYKFAVTSGDSTGVLNYNKPGDGKAVDMSDPNQMHLVSDDQRKAVAEMPEGEGGKPQTHDERRKARKVEEEKKAAARKATVQ